MERLPAEDCHVLIEAVAGRDAAQGRDPRVRSRARCRGLSLAELLVALAITAMLLTATMVAVDASFKSYAVAAESASTQVSTRMVVHRLMTMIRTGVAQGPLTSADEVVGFPTPTYSGNNITSSYMIIEDNRGNLVTLEYRSADNMIYYTTEPVNGGTAVTQPLLGGVTSCTFRLRRRRDASTNFAWVLERGSVDMTVQPDADASLGLESGNSPPIQVVTSTAPRRLR